MRALVILLALTIVAGIATAEPKRKAAPDKFAKAAGEAFKAALEADTKNDLRTALGLYQKAHAISPHPVTMYNIADVQRRLQQLEQAIKSYETYLVMSPDAKDRAEVEKVIDELSKTPGTLVVTTVDASNPQALDLPAAFVLVDGEIKKRPGPVPIEKPRNIQMIKVAVPPGKHVIDLVTPLTYAHDDCEVGPGEQRYCEMKAEPRIDGNAVISAYDRSKIDVTTERYGKDLVHKRFELPAGKHRLLMKDRSYGCAPLSVETAGGNTVSYTFLTATEYDGFKRCRPIDIKQHRLQFEP